MMKKLIVIAVFMLLFSSVSCFAKCPTGWFKVMVLCNNPDIQELHAEIRDNMGITKTDLKMTEKGLFQGEIGFLTMGYVFFVELSCSYFPDEITLYSNDNDRKIIPLDVETIKKNHTGLDNEYSIILQY